MKRPVIIFSLSLLIIVAVSFFIQFRSPNIADNDSFYHIAHAKIYGQNGIFNTSFPWTQYSAIKEYKGDLWYGFHLVLIPLTYIPDNMEIKTAGFTITALSLIILFFAFKNFNVRYPLFWTVILPFTSSSLLFRISMLRPHVLSLSLSFLFLSYLIKKSSKGIFITSFLISFIHLNVFWIPLLILSIYCGVKEIHKERNYFNSSIYTFLGVVAGFILHPHPIGTLKLLYIQLVDSVLIKFHSVPLRYAGELYPANLENFLSQILPLLLLTALIIFIFHKKIKERKNETFWILAILAIVYMVLTLGAARRFLELFAVAAVFLTAVIISPNISLMALREKKNMLLSFSGLAIIAVIGWHSIIDSNTSFAASPPPDKFREPAEWLEEHTKPGEIVFHTYWEHLPSLFYWNQKNYYINGMDPVFMYEYRPDLYWAAHFIAINMAGEITCQAQVCPPGKIVNTYEALKKDFKASYVLVQQNINKKFDTHMAENNKLFTLVFETPTVKIYRIN